MAHTWEVYLPERHSEENLLFSHFMWCFNCLLFQIGSCGNSSPGPPFYLALDLMVTPPRELSQGDSSHSPFPFIPFSIRILMHPTGCSKIPVHAHNICSLLKGHLLQNYLYLLFPKIPLKSTHLLSGVRQFGYSGFFFFKVHSYWLLIPLC